MLFRSRYQQALALQPDFAQALHNLGNALASLDKHEEAVSILQKAIEVQPNFAEALTSLGISLYALKRHSEEVQCYERALVLKPDYLNPRLQLIYMCARHGSARPELERELVKRVMDYPAATEISPFILMHIVASASAQKVIASRYGSSLARADTPSAPLAVRARADGRLREIGRAHV